MDISLNNISMDCELKSEYFKWKLYKEEALLSSGSFSPKFDSMKNNRLVLTNTQERLTTNEDKYTLLIYLAESCTGDLSTCNANSGSYNQETLLNKNFSATMKVELSTGNKKIILEVLVVLLRVVILVLVFLLAILLLIMAVVVH